MEPIGISRQIDQNASDSTDIWRKVPLYANTLAKYARFLRIAMFLYGFKLVLMPLVNLVAEYAILGEMRIRALPESEAMNPLIWYRLGTDMFSACFPALCCFAGGLFVKAVAQMVLATANIATLNETRVADPSCTNNNTATDAMTDSTQV